MYTYCKLKSGVIMVVLSDDPTEEAMELYSLEKLEDSWTEFLECTRVPYSEIEKTDTNLSLLLNV